MAFTFLQFQDQVKRFIKIEGTDSTQLAKDLINVALYEVARANLWPELLRTNIVLVLTGASAGAVVPLNTGTLQIERARYRSQGKEWSLVERTKLVPPAGVYGKPRAYALVRGPTTEPHGIQLDPYTAIDSIGDQCLVDIYVAPPLLVADGDTPQSNNWDTAILRKAEQLFLIHQNKIPSAQVILQAMAQANQQQQQS